MDLLNEMSDLDDIEEIEFPEDKLPLHLNSESVPQLPENLDDDLSFQ